MAGLLALRFFNPLRLLRRFRSDNSGATAVEFAFIGGPFLMLCFAIVETCVVMGAGVLLDSAVSETARQVMTGEVQEKDLDKAGFRKLICDQVSVLLNCDKVKIDLRTVSAATAIPKSYSMALGKVDDSKFCYDPGAQQSITVLRAAYEWPWIAGFLQQFVAASSNGNAVLFSMAAFMNEPYGAVASTHADCV